MPFMGNGGVLLGLSTLTALLTEKEHPIGPFQEILFGSKETLSFCRELRRAIARITSQSLKSLYRLSFQLPFPTV